MVIIEAAVGVKVGVAALVDVAVGPFVGVAVAARVGVEVASDVGVAVDARVGVDVAGDVGVAVGTVVGVGPAPVSSTKTQSPEPSELFAAGVNGCEPVFANGEPEIAEYWPFVGSYHFA
jgi:hypothetical protein